MTIPFEALPVDTATPVRLLPRQISYSDPNELAILDYITSITDLRLCSDELHSSRHEWVYRYHFSQARANVIRPIIITANDNILEIGSGCGAITRYLGETGARVTAVEGTLPRARITYLRTADLPNVNVAAGDVTDYCPPTKHSVVTMIGVLEYARLALPGVNDPYLHMLTYAHDALNADGCLILAIENQLGLKYLLGYPEDHTHIPYQSCEGYAHTSPVSTFHKRQLSQLLSAAGFKCQQWLYPFPDYKLPTTIISEDAFRAEGTYPNLADLLRPAIHDYTTRHKPLSDQQLIAREITKAGIMPELANSFLIVAGATPRSIEKRIISACPIYSFSDTNRRPRFQTRSMFLTTQRVIKVATFPSANLQSPTAVHNGYSTAEYLRGPLLLSALEQSCNNNDYKSFRHMLLDYYTWFSLSYKRTQSPLETSPSLFDAHPGNVIMSATGLVSFDAEWTPVQEHDIESTWWRHLINLSSQLFTHTSAEFLMPRKSVFATAAQLWALTKQSPVPHTIHDAYIATESAFQSEVTGDNFDTVAEKLTIETTHRQPPTTLLRAHTKTHTELEALKKRIEAHESSRAFTTIRRLQKLSSSTNIIMRYLRTFQPW